MRLNKTYAEEHPTNKLNMKKNLMKAKTEDRTSLQYLPTPYYYL